MTSGMVVTTCRSGSICHPADPAVPISNIPPQ